MGFALDFRGDRRGADRALWKHLHDITSAEVGGVDIEDVRESWIVEWTERDSGGRFVDSGTHSIHREKRLAEERLKKLRERSGVLSYTVRRIQHPAGKLSKSVRFRGYREVLSLNERGPLLTRDGMILARLRNQRAKFVRCYVRMP